MSARSLFAATAGLVLLAAAGCGDDAADATEEAELGVAEVVGDRLGAAAGEVEVVCPDDLEAEPGTEFTCVVAVGGSAPVEVSLAVAGDGTVELQRAVVPTEAAEAYLTGASRRGSSPTSATTCVARSCEAAMALSYRSS
jgi:hypothetical protein